MYRLPFVLIWNSENKEQFYRTTWDIDSQTDRLQHTSSSGKYVLICIITKGCAVIRRVTIYYISVFTRSINSKLNVEFRVRFSTLRGQWGHCPLSCVKHPGADVPTWSSSSVSSKNNAVNYQKPAECIQMSNKTAGPRFVGFISPTSGYSMNKNVCVTAVSAPSSSSSSTAADLDSSPEQRGNAATWTR